MPGLTTITSARSTVSGANLNPTRVWPKVCVGGAGGDRVELVDVVLRGTVTWTNFGPKREEWLGFIFLVTEWAGTPPSANDEGTLEWIDQTRLIAACSDDEAERAPPICRCGKGIVLFVPLVFDDDPRAFHGTMPYDGDRPTSWTYERL